MSEDRDNEDSHSSGEALSGTTLKVYRYLYRIGEPKGIRDVQNGLHLSSSSVASYHLKKLLAMGLVKEREDSQKYYVDRIVFENMIRFRRSLIPIQVGYLAFFGCALAILLIVFRPYTLNGAYVFSVIVIGLACAVFVYQAFRSLKSSAI